MMMMNLKKEVIVMWSNFRMVMLMFVKPGILFVMCLVKVRSHDSLMVVPKCVYVRDGRCVQAIRCHYY